MNSTDLLNRRISVQNKVGTVRFVGQLDLPQAGSELWLGVDWDGAEDGKHDGCLQGRRYFQASYPTSGSFVRVKDALFGRGFFEALRDHNTDDVDHDPDVQIVVRKKDAGLSLIQSRRYVSLECCRVEFVESEDTFHFPNCTVLYLQCNFLTKWTNVFDILRLFPVLNLLDLSKNRLESIELPENLPMFPNLHELSLAGAKLDEKTISTLPAIFPNIKSLFLMDNNLSIVPDLTKFENLEILDLSKNPLNDFKKILALKNMKNLKTLNLKACGFNNVEFDEPAGFELVHTIYLDSNPIGDWESVNQLARLKSLRTLRPGDLYCSERNLQAYEIITAKLPGLETLSGCQIGVDERRNCEKFFQVRFSSPPIDPVHQADLNRLRLKYGDVEPTTAQSQATSQSLQFTLLYKSKSVTRSLLQTVDVRQVVSMGARLFRFAPSTVRVRVQVGPGMYDDLHWDCDQPLRSFDPMPGCTIEFVPE